MLGHGSQGLSKKCRPIFLPRREAAWRRCVSSIAERRTLHFARESEALFTCSIVFRLAVWISRQQLIVVEYLKAENSMLRERLSVSTRDSLATR